MLGKKYFIAGGCSFTEGHFLKEKGSWATYFAKNNNLELVNLGKGGAGNEYIFTYIIQYSKINKEIADNAIFGIQLSEVLRTLMCFTFPKINESTIGYDNGKYTHITPVQFMKEETFENWDLTSFHNKWIYDNRYGLAPFFINVTHSVLITINALIGFIDFCKANNYPYFIFDGLNKNIPEKTEDGWGLVSNVSIDCHKVEVAENIESDFKFFTETGYPIIHKSIIDYLNSIPNYFKDISLKDYLFRLGESNYNDSEFYIAGNERHPNEMGSQKWAEYLQPIVDNLFGKIN